MLLLLSVLKLRRMADLPPGGILSQYRASQPWERRRMLMGIAIGLVGPIAAFVLGWLVSGELWIGGLVTFGYVLLLLTVTTITGAIKVLRGTNTPVGTQWENGHWRYIPRESDQART